MAKYGREFFIAPNSDDAGIPWDNFVTAVQVWSFMRGRTTVREAADAFNVADQIIRDAAADHYWMALIGPDDDATKQFIEHEGD